MKKFISLFFLVYLRLLAQIQLIKIRFLLRLRGKKLTIIGVTGSAGKTSTLAACEAALTPDFRVKTSSGANTESGLPLNILGFKVTNFSPLDWLLIALISPFKLLINWRLYDVYIAEMGVDEPVPPKNMGYLLTIIRPDIGIFLNVGAVHSLQFDKTVSDSIQGDARLQAVMENIAREKARLINSLSPQSTAIINIDDPLVTKTTTLTPARKLTLSAKSGASLKIVSTCITPPDYSVTYSLNNRRFHLNLKNMVLPSIYNVSLGSALLAAVTLGIEPDRAVANLETNFHLPYSRSTMIKGIHQSTLIDSSYNSSPTATLEMLKLLSAFPGRKIAILGDMRELGWQSAQAHQHLFIQAQKYSDLIIGIGPETQKYFDCNSSPIPALTFRFWWQADDYLQNHTGLLSGSAVLVKGSQNTIYLEELVKALLQNPTDAAKLCRQTSQWLKIKSDFRQHHETR